MSDPWGVVEGFHDAHGVWQATSSDAATSCRRAMGAHATGVDESPTDRAPLLVTRSDRATPLTGRGVLHLENGKTIEWNGVLPHGLPLGYHRLTGHPSVRMIAVAPPQAVPVPRRMWGWSVQVPSLWDSHTIGTGDLGTLERFGTWAASTGASVLITNPLNAPVMVTPRDPSPYSPSSRIWRDPLLLEVSGTPNIAVAAMDRDAAWFAKRPMLEAQWQQLTPDEAESLAAWRAAQGSGLELFAIHEACVDHFGRAWPTWPEAYRHPAHPEVAEIAEALATQVTFHAWLQWRLDHQLAAVATKIGLVADLPVGINPSGADAWQFQDVIATGVHVGAPPDAFNPAGQDWGLAAFNPHALRAAGYQPIIDSLRHTMTHATGIRIDHLMGLFRLYWVPTGAGAAQGAYVRQFAEDLLSLVCLESARADAFVIGEDLGTVQGEVREAMADRGIGGTRLVWFEDTPANELPASSLASISTHDLPTVAGMLHGSDARERVRLGIAVDVDADAELLHRLARVVVSSGGSESNDAVAMATQALGALAAGSAGIVTASLEDALGIEPRVNMPGTSVERANWSARIPLAIDSLGNDPGVQVTVERLASNRLISSGTSCSGTAGE